MLPQSAQGTPPLENFGIRKIDPAEERQNIMNQALEMQKVQGPVNQMNDLLVRMKASADTEIANLQRQISKLMNKTTELQRTLDQSAVPTTRNNAASAGLGENLNTCRTEASRFVDAAFKHLPSFWRTAQLEVIMRAVRNSFVSHRHAAAVVEPSLPYDLVSGKLQNSNAFESETTAPILAESLVLPVRVFNAEKLLPLSNNFRDIDSNNLATGERFGRYFCKRCNQMCRSTGHWGIRMGYDVDTPFIFIYRIYECNCNMIELMNVYSNTDDAPDEEKAIRPTANSNDFVHSIRLRVFLQNACPEYVRRMCPVICSSKLCFTHRLRDHVREAAISRSNTNEQSKMIQRRYADSHLTRVALLLSFMQSHQTDSRDYYAYCQLKAARGSLHGTFAPPIRWENWSRDLFGEIKNGKWQAYPSMVQSPFRSPSDEFLRTTVLRPHLQEIRPTCERLMDLVPRTRILALDSTYFASGQIYQKSGGGVAYRSAAAVVNCNKQIVTMNFMLSDSIMCLSPIFKRINSIDSPDGHFVIYTDRCCADANSFQQMYGDSCSLRLDPWHWLSRFYYHNTLPKNNIADRHLHELIMKGIRETLFEKLSSEKGETRCYIPEAGILAKAFDNLYASWVETEGDLKRIVTTDKFKKRWELQMVHVKKGCLSDPFRGTDMYYTRYVSSGDGKYKSFHHALRGTNVNENIHKQINALIPSTGRMSQQFCAELLAYFVYRHNYENSVRWVPGEREYFAHSNPLLFFDTADLFHMTLNLDGNESNPLYTKFHGPLIRCPSHTPDHFYFDSLEPNAPAQGEIATSSLIPIVGWLDEEAYRRIVVSTLTADLKVADFHPISPRCIRKGADSKMRAFYDAFGFPSGAPSFKGHWHPQKLLLGEKVCLSQAISDMISELPPTSFATCDFVENNTTSVNTLFSKLADVVEIGVFPQPPPALEPLLGDRQVDEYDASLWSEIINAELDSNEVKTRVNIFWKEVKLCYVLQRAAEILNVVIALFRVGHVPRKGPNGSRLVAGLTACNIDFDDDIPFFVPRDAALVQHRTPPRQLVLCSLSILGKHNSRVKVLGALDVVFDKLHPQAPKNGRRRQEVATQQDAAPAAAAAAAATPSSPPSRANTQHHPSTRRERHDNDDDDQSQQNNSAVALFADDDDNQQQQEQQQQLLQQQQQQQENPPTSSNSFTRKAKGEHIANLKNVVNDTVFLRDPKVLALAKNFDVTKDSNGNRIKCGLYIQRANEVLKPLGWFIMDKTHIQVQNYFLRAKQQAESNETTKQLRAALKVKKLKMRNKLEQIEVPPP